MNKPIIRIARDHRSCGCCDNANYEGRVAKTKKVDVIFEIVVGNMVSAVCPDCLQSLRDTAFTFLNGYAPSPEDQERKPLSIPFIEDGQCMGVLTVRNSDDRCCDIIEALRKAHCENPDSYAAALRDAGYSAEFDNGAWVIDFDSNCDDEEENAESALREEAAEEVDVCPVCGGPIEPEDVGDDDGCGELYLHWECERCGTKGKAVHQTEHSFVCHEYESKSDEDA